MNCTLYYFSATGNSLTTAQLLAEQLENCRLKAVTSCFKDSKIIEDGEMVGIVCPVYYGTVPYPIRELLNKLVFTAEHPYLFLLNTYKGHCGAAAQRVDLLLQSRGQKLSFAGGIPMPGNSFLNKPGKDEESLSLQKENLALFVEQLKQKPVQDFDHSELLPLRPVDYPNNFRGILAENSCIEGTGPMKSGNLPKSSKVPNPAVEDREMRVVKFRRSVSAERSLFCKEKERKTDI